MGRTVKTVVFWLVIGVSAMLLWRVIKSGKTEQALPEISYSQFMSQVEGGEVAKVTIAGSKIIGQTRTGRGFRVIGPTNQALFLDVLHAKGVEIWFREISGDNLSLQLLGTWAPLILLAALWFFMIRQMQKRTSPRQQGPSQPTSPNL